MANNKYINSINALGVSLSLIAKYIHIEQDTQAMDQPTHCVSGLAFDKTKQPTIAIMKPNHRIPFKFL